MRTMRRKNRTKRQYRKSFTKRRTKRIKRTKRTKRTKKSSKSKDDLKRFKKLQQKLEKLLMNNASTKEIDKISKQLADLQKKMIKSNKKRMKGGVVPGTELYELKKSYKEAKKASGADRLNQRMAPKGPRGLQYPKRPRSLM